MKWEKSRKPPNDVCPEEFCFMWSESSQNCRETFGRCRRATARPSDKDFYEPCEPELERHGLPWFYFIADANGLADEFKDKYLKESSELWANG